MKLLFDHKSKTIVLQFKKEYYSMKDGKPCNKPESFSILKPFPREFKTKWIPMYKFNLLMLTLFNAEQIEYGYKICFGKSTLFIIFDDQDNFQLCGNFPRYFFKGFLNFVKNIQR